MNEIKAGGIIQNLNLTQITITSAPNQPGIITKIFGALGEKNINIQFIVQGLDWHNKNLIILCITQEDHDAGLAALEGARIQEYAEKVTCCSGVNMLSVFGPHFRDNPGISGIAFAALAAAGVEILAISTSISTISCIVAEQVSAQAVEALREAFNVPASAVFTASDGLSLRTKG